MRTSIVLGLAALGTAALAGCADQASTAPTGVQASIAGATCDFQGLKKSVIDYFAGGTDQNTGQNILTAMTAATGSARDDQGFNLLAWTATVTDAGRQTSSAATGSALVNGTLACMSSAVTSPDLPADFAPALSDGGAFAVRGGTSDPAGPVLARGTSVSWGVEPPPSFTWSQITGGQRSLIYGNPLGTFATTEELTGTGYHWGRVPAGSFSPAALVGYCVTGSDRLLIQHHQAADGVLLQSAVPSFCTTTVGAADNDWSLKSLARRTAELFVGKPLYASAAFATGPGGLAGGFSDFGAVDGEHVNLTFSTQPADAKTTGIVPAFEVTARADGGTPFAGVPVTIAIAGNNGSWTLTGTATRVTNDQGIATFDDINVNKAGGYTLQATSQIGAFSASSTISTMFHITQ